MLSKGMRYIIGLDIGIGTIGWAVVRYDEPRRVEKFGVRTFEPGESNRGKDRDSQERRMYRAGRRLIRRRVHRKHRVKVYLEKIGLVRRAEVEEFVRGGEYNVIQLRVKGLDEKLTAEEIAACLINFCNKRGFQDFYDLTEFMLEDMSDKEKTDYESQREGAALVDRFMKEGDYRTVGEMILKDMHFEGPGKMRQYRNSKYRESRIQINRNHLREEFAKIMKKQQEYYPQIHNGVIETLEKIIFQQRCFEDGPGDVNDKFRRYTGYLDNIGKCRFYPDEERGCRFTVLADIYSLINAVSQYRFANADGWEELPPDMAKDIVDHVLTNGNVTLTQITSIAKTYGVKQIKDKSVDNNALKNAIKFVAPVKKILEEHGVDWRRLIEYDYADMNSPLNQLGLIVSHNQTPSRRIKELKKLDFIPKDAIERVAAIKFSGTCNVCNTYMKGAIEAFLQGEKYGGYQAKILKEYEKKQGETRKQYRLPSFENQKDEFEFYKNPVVCRAINETRKLVNEIINRFGSPYAINIEVASDLNRSYLERRKVEKANRANENDTARIREKVADICGIDEAAVSGRQIECCRLYEIQNGKCLYSGKDLILEDCLDPKNRTYEIDHIVPYSRVLDNTIHNKALVLHAENQFKGQRTPLMYLQRERAEEFIKRVRDLRRTNAISEKKLAYLLQENLYDEIIDEWKSRNINDTRYISKFLVRYFRENLIFNHEKDEAYRQTEVYAVKGTLTSKFRRLWLNEATWGKHDKAELKEVTLLDHAADAIIIACCIPAYVEIAGVQNQLQIILKRNGRRPNDEYRMVRDACCKTMQKYYGLNPRTVLPLLESSDRTPCLIPRLREEVDARFIEPETHRYFGKDEQKEMTDDEIVALYHTKCRELYYYDHEFADSLQPFVASRKPDRSYKGQITTANAISVREIDGVQKKLHKKPIVSVQKKELRKVYSGDGEMLRVLQELLEPMKPDQTVGDALRQRGEEVFVTPSGRKINRVTLLDNVPNRMLVKQSGKNNVTVMDSAKYYCIELYLDSSKRLMTRGIAYSEVIKAGGKLWLSENHQYPKDYEKHVMYLQKGDYLKIKERNGQVKFEGFFASTKNINRSCLYFYSNGGTKLIEATIGKQNFVSKYEISIFGELGGEVRCGEPLLSITEKRYQ